MPEIEELLEEIIKRIAKIEEIVFAPQVEGTTAKPSPENAKSKSDQLRKMLSVFAKKYGLKQGLEIFKGLDNELALLQRVREILSKPLAERTWDEMVLVKSYIPLPTRIAEHKRMREFRKDVDLTKDISYDEFAKIRLDRDPVFEKLLKLPYVNPDNSIPPKSEPPIINIAKMERETDGNTMILEEIRARQRAERKRLGLEN